MLGTCLQRHVLSKDEQIAPRGKAEARVCEGARTERCRASRKSQHKDPQRQTKKEARKLVKKAPNSLYSGASGVAPPFGGQKMVLQVGPCLIRIGAISRRPRLSATSDDVTDPGMHQRLLTPTPPAQSSRGRARANGFPDRFPLHSARKDSFQTRIRCVRLTPTAC